MGNYSIQARRFVMQQVDTLPSPCFSTEAQASSTFEALKLNATWRLTPRGTLAVLPVTGSENTEGNMAKLDNLDAFSFCTDHKDGQHILRMGLVAYRATLPNAFIGTNMSSISINLHGDPFLRDGTIVGIVPSASDLPASDWVTTMQNAQGKIIQGAKRTEVSAATPSCPNCVTWFSQSKVYALTGNTTFDDGATGSFPSGGITLQKHLFIYIAMANYQRVRNAWVEGSAMMNSAIAFTAAGVGLPPDGALPSGDDEAFVVEQVSDLNIRNLPSRIPYLGVDPSFAQTPNPAERLFGQGCSVGLTHYIPNVSCEYSLPDMLAHIMMLKSDPKGYMDLVFATDATGGSDSAKTTCLFAGMALYLGSVYPTVGVGNNLYNLIRKYQRTRIKLQSLSNTYRLQVYIPVAGTGVGGDGSDVTVSANSVTTAQYTNARITATLWFLPNSVLHNEHPDVYILRNGTHKKPQFWAGNVPSLDGLIRLNDPIAIPNNMLNYMTGMGFNVPVTIPPQLDGQSGTLFIAPDLAVADLTPSLIWENRIDEKFSSNVDEPPLQLIPIVDDNNNPNGFATQAYFASAETKWLRTMYVKVFNGKTSGQTVTW